MLLSIKLFKDIFLDKLQATDETVPSTRDKAMSWRKMGPIMCRSHVIHALLGGPLRRLHFQIKGCLSAAYWCKDSVGCMTFLI